MTVADALEDIITRVKAVDAETDISGRCDFVYNGKVYDGEDLRAIGRSRVFCLTVDGDFSLVGPMGTRTEWTEIETSAVVSISYQLGASAKAVQKAALQDRDSIAYALTRADYYPDGVSRRLVTSASFSPGGMAGEVALLEVMVATLYQPTFT